LTAMATFTGDEASIKAVNFELASGGAITCGAGGSSCLTDYCRREGVAPYALYGDTAGALYKPTEGCELPATTQINMRVVVENTDIAVESYTLSATFVLVPGCFLMAPPSNVDPRSGFWTLLDEAVEPAALAPEPRHESSFTLARGKLYLIGGRTLHANARNVDIWDPVEGMWVANPTLADTPDHHHFQPVVVDENIWVATAMTGGYPRETPLAYIWIYDTLADSYYESDIKIPTPRGGAGAVYYKDKIYIVSGIEDGHYNRTIKDFSSFDVAGYKALPWNLTDREAAIADLWVKLPDVPHERDHTQAIVLNGRLYLMGGRISNLGEDNDVFDDLVNQVDVYDFSMGRWLTPAEAPPDVPVGGAAPAVVVWRNTILFMGGEAPDGAHDVTFQYSDVTHSWTQLADMSTGRHGFGAANYNDYVFIGGGSRVLGGGNTADVLVFPQHSSTTSPTGGDCAAP